MTDTIVLYPSPGMGHIISMVELGKLILHYYPNQFSISILVITTDLYGDNPAITNYIAKISQSHPSISFLRFPIVPVSKTPPRSFPAMGSECIGLNATNAVQSLNQILKTNRITAFVIDLFCSSALSIGKELNIPTYYFFTSGAACLGAFLHIPRIQEKLELGLKNGGGTLFLDFPCMPPLKSTEVPEPMLVRDDPAYDYFVWFCTQLPKSDGIIVNTFEELEPRAIKALTEDVFVIPPMNPVYCVGPLIQVGDDGEHHCLSWLDGQPSKSVVFLCFGSRGSFSAEQVKEIAHGLERSGQRFLWVIKNPPQPPPTAEGASKLKNQTHDLLGDFDVEAMLPDGFMTRVGENKGMVVKSWAPQQRILSHSSVGGFVTHCGWNSVLESVVGGVPMVAWPLHAEQHLNRNVLVEDMKIAIPVEQGEEDGFVRGEEVERRVRELMDSEKGRELKERCWKMKEMSLAAWDESSGSSAKALARLVQTWNKT